MKTLLTVLIVGLIFFLVRHFVTGPAESELAQTGETMPSALSELGGIPDAHKYIYGGPLDLSISTIAPTASTDLIEVTKAQRQRFAGLLELPPISFNFALSSVSQSDADAFVVYGLAMIRVHPKKAVRYSQRLSEFYQLQHSAGEDQIDLSTSSSRPGPELSTDFPSLKTAQSSLFRSFADLPWLAILQWFLLLVLAGGVFGLYRAWKTGGLTLFAHEPRPPFGKQGYSSL